MMATVHRNTHAMKQHKLRWQAEALEGIANTYRQRMREKEQFGICIIDAELLEAEATQLRRRAITAGRPGGYHWQKQVYVKAEGAKE